MGFYCMLYIACIFHLKMAADMLLHVNDTLTPLVIVFLLNGLLEENMFIEYNIQHLTGFRL